MCREGISHQPLLYLPHALDTSRQQKEGNADGQMWQLWWIVSCLWKHSQSCVSAARFLAVLQMHCSLLNEWLNIGMLYIKLFVMKLSNYLLKRLPWIPNLGEFIVQSVMLKENYVFNSNSLNFLRIVMKSMAYWRANGVYKKVSENVKILLLKYLLWFFKV